jgi:hypothetical protein
MKLYLCLVNSALRRQDIWGSGGITPRFLTSTLDEAESSLRLDRFTPGTHWLGGWVDPEIGLDVVEKRKILPRSLYGSTVIRRLCIKPGRF